MSDTAQTLIQRVTDTLYAPFRYSGSGIPEGVQTSEPGWIYRDTNNGLLWFKKTGSAATGWKALEGSLFSNITTASTTGAATDTLQSDTIPAGTLQTNGDVIEFEYAGTISTGSATALYLKFNGSNILTQTVTPNGSGIPWRITGKLIRVSSSTIRATLSIVYGNDAGITTLAQSFLYDVTASSASSLVLALSTVLTATDKCSKYLGTAKLVPAP